MDEYLANAKAINEAKSAEGVYGTVGQMKSGHYSLECDMTAYVWGHGGSVFTADGMCSLNDAKAVTGVDYMRELQTYMPGAVTTYDWDGQATAIQQGQGGQVMTWGEDFPELGRPDQLQRLRSDATGRAAGRGGATPTGRGRVRRDPGGRAPGRQCLLSVPLLQGGRRRLGLPPVGDQLKHPDPRLGPRRRGEPHAALDLRRPACQGDEAGRRRHHPPLHAMLQTIKTRMGTEPHLPQWPSIATDMIAVELGKLTTGGYASTQEGMDQIKKLVDEAAAKLVAHVVAVICTGAEERCSSAPARESSRRLCTDQGATVSRVTVMGAGDMGTALVTPLAHNGHEVRLWGTERDGADHRGASRREPASASRHPGPG